jgi:hypothetical protein
MVRRTAVRLVNAARGRPVTSMVVVGVLGATVAATALGASSQSGGPITAVSVVRETQPFNVNATSYVDVTGATTSITVPSGQRGLIIARFEATSFCVPGSGGVACEGDVRILIGGVEGAPGGDTTFDSTMGNNSVNVEAHEIERSRGGIGGLPAGTYQVKVQARVASGGVLDLGARHLTVERSQVG